MVIEFGDKPYSSICDYMSSCSYTCKMVNDQTNMFDNIQLNEDIVNDDTFNNMHNLNNLNILIYNIKVLFSEKHFYYYSDIVDRLNHFNKYTDEEIKEALNIIINDKNEEISDIYDRPGYIVNYGEIYFFQPKEITSQDISFLERTTPLDYKRSNLEISQPYKDIINDTNENTKVSDATNLEDKNIIDSFLSLISIYKETREFNTIKNIVSTYNFPDKENIVEFIDNVFPHHIVFENLPYNKRYELLQIINVEPEKLDILKKYILQHSFYYDENEYLLFSNNNGVVLFEKSENEWVQASTLVERDALSEIKDKFVININNIFEYLGITNYNSKKDDKIIFKIKNTFNKSSKGAICINMYKNDLIEIINTIFPSSVDKIRIQREQTIHLCLLIQVLMRYNHHVKQDNKIWFFNPTLTNIQIKYNKSIKL